MDIVIKLAELAIAKSRREKRPINKRVIASETGLPRNTVAAYWDNDIKRFDKKTLLVLCEYLNCYLDDLMVQVATEEDLAKLGNEEEHDPELAAV